MTYFTASLPTILDANRFAQGLLATFPNSDLMVRCSPIDGRGVVNFTTDDQVVAAAAHTLATAPPEWAGWQPGTALFSN